MREREDEAVEFENSVCSAETEKAIRAKVDGEFHWIPKSQLHDDSEIYRNGDTGKLVVKEWWAKKEGWI